MKVIWTIILLSIAVVTDVRSGKVSNWLIGIGLCSGILFQIWESGSRGLVRGVMYAIIPIVLLFLLFLMHALGAGDIKLFSMIGCIWNLKLLMYCIIASFCVGAVYGLVNMIRRKNLWTRLQSFGMYVRDSLAAGRPLNYRQETQSAGNEMYFTIAILIGFCIAMGVIR